MKKKPLVAAILAVASTQSYAQIGDVFLGLNDEEHTSLYGAQYSQTSFINANGFAAGFSSRYGIAEIVIGGPPASGSGPPTVVPVALGQSAWFFDGLNTTQVGLIDGRYAGDLDGYRYSAINGLNASGSVIGQSTFFEAGLQAGDVSWLYNGVTTVELGLSGSEFIYSGGLRGSHASRISNSGIVAGTSSKSGGSKVAWRYQAGTTTAIGLTDAQHSNTIGVSNHTVELLNELGDVAGTATRYSGNSNAGTSVWLNDGVTTTRVGLFDTAHTLAGNLQMSSLSFLAQNGAVFGHSTSYVESSQVVGPPQAGQALRGRSAWVADQSGISQIGLTDAAHQSALGLNATTAVAFNESGQAAGVSSAADSSISSAWHYDGVNSTRIGMGAVNVNRNHVVDMNEAGQVIGGAAMTETSLSAWIYGQSITQQIGLQSGGYETAKWLNEAGHVVGITEQESSVAGPPAPGVTNPEITVFDRAVWFFDGQTTQQIGLTDAEHTAASGVHIGDATDINEASQVIGYSDLFLGNDNHGQTAWVYTSDTSIALDADTRSDGWEYSAANYLGEDGLVLGYFEDWDDIDDSYLGDTLFAWTEMDGQFELLAGVDLSALSLSQWEQLAIAYRNGGFSGGDFTESAFGDMAKFVFISSVPVPAAAWLFASGLAVLSGLQGRRRNSAA